MKGQHIYNCLLVCVFGCISALAPNLDAHAQDATTVKALKQCEALSNAKKPEKAVPCFEAALNLKAGVVKSSIPALKPDLLFQIGRSYRSTGNYKNASIFFELLVEKHPQHKDVQEALGNAATFRQKLGEHAKAIANYQTFLKLFPKDKKVGVEVFFHIGTLYEEQGDSKKAHQRYKDYITKYTKVGPPDLHLRAHTRSGMILWRAGKRTQAQAEFATTLKLYDAMSAKTRNELNRGRDAAARAKFMQGEEQMREAAAVRLTLPESKFIKSLEKKIAVHAKARALYLEVLSFKSSDWTVAALHQNGVLFQNLANAIRKSPIPGNVAPERHKIYMDGLEKKARNLEASATASYVKCIETAQDLRRFNVYSNKAQQALAKLDHKGEFKNLSAFQVPPKHFNSKLKANSFK